MSAQFADVPPMVVENLLSGVVFPAMFVSLLIGMVVGAGAVWAIRRFR